MGVKAVRHTLDDAIALIELDDGKVNVLTHEVIAALGEALDASEQAGVRAVVLAGRTGCFSAGFDLAVIREGPRSAVELLLAGGDLAIRLFSFPAPVVLAVTGHALAMGAVLCCSADVRIGADGDFKLGLNEVAIGIPVPEVAVELARERLSHRHWVRAVCQAEIYSPSTAVEAGYLDRVVPAESVVEEAVAAARALAAALDPTAYRTTKLWLRGASVDRLRRHVSEARSRL